MRDTWQMFTGALPSEMCNHMITNFLQIDPQDASTFNQQGDIRRSQVRWVRNEVGLIDVLLKYVNLANAVAFNVDIQQEMDEMQFTEYDSEYQGKYDWHHDINWQNEKNFDRKLSISVQLSNPESYIGGKFEFGEVESPDPEEFGKQGSILIFPSYLRHRVTEVTEGTRYSLVSWVRGPRWR